ncbi:MAG: hypothetical protein ABIH99_05830 [Candidatus Micrarchaeota archaeon]
MVLPKGMKHDEALPVVLQGIYGGVVCGYGMLAIGAMLSPPVALALVSASALGTGFVTTLALHAEAKKISDKKNAGVSEEVVQITSDVGSTGISKDVEAVSSSASSATFVLELPKEAEMRVAAPAKFAVKKKALAVKRKQPKNRRRR